MTGRERILSVFNGEVPDKVPHFELVFQIPEEAFNMSWPTYEDMKDASTSERVECLERYFTIYEKIIETYGWAAIDLPTSLNGYFQGEVIPEGIKRFGDRVSVYSSNGNGTFWMLPGSEMMDFTIKLFEDPQELHRQAKIKRDASIELAKYQADQGVDFICINSDYGYNQGPFISPKMFSEFVTPYLEEIVGAMHNLGLKTILHSDGDLRLILDQIVSTGMDGYQSIDPQGHMDIAKVKQEYGDRLVLMGNVQSSLLQEANEPLIRDSVRYAMTNGKPGGGYIFSTSNCIF